MALQPIVLVNLALIVAFPPVYVAARRLFDEMALWKPPFAAGMYLSLVCTTLVEIADVAPVTSYRWLSSALHAVAVLAAVGSITLLVCSWRARRAADDAPAAERLT